MTASAWPARGAFDLRIERDVPVPLPDGTVLRADVWRPADGPPAPVLLQRTPYDKSFALVVQGGLDPARAVAAGYAVVVQDVRGRYASDGRFEPLVDEAADGAATIAWAAAQPFCDGRVATYGGSYGGATQLLAARERPPALRALLPHVTAADYHDDWFYEGGAFQLGFALHWARGLAAGELARRRARGEQVAALEELLEAELADPATAYRRLPLLDQPLLAELAPYYLRWLEHPLRDDFWQALSPRERFAAIDVPALHLGGWHDIFLPGTLAGYAALRDAGHATQRLVIGPWAHGGWGDAVGEVIYGPQASRYALDPTDLHLRWFDEVLQRDGWAESSPGEPAAPDPDAPLVRIFVMGADRWRDEQEWPLARARTRRLHLRADAALTWEPPAPGEAQRTYVYDPADPVPTTGGRTLMAGHEASIALGARDSRAVQARPDVLVYTSAPLERALEVTGVVRLILQAASSAPDTDWTAKLLDVQPDGRALAVADGIVRARFRDGHGHARPLEPGVPERFAIEVGATAIVFAPGHRVQLELSSSNFPRFDRNPNTGGGEPAHARACDLRTAHQRIFHDAARASWLELPVVAA
ncbi:CocE/NonD family hydrolase [Conexibacter stalactiti]|uniref:CocE/NonD family hydrolase n=1 Tax=Conexibacter stalactiti TaxID=1940611 RepID=A0ABU4HYU9_9ACTN|nr:CocE/NonD family hydrolase [Conexibacter stalactiti]MDW5598502.1 CocE/NonD family hydrolase [Conexibacter stalactiti]MEC5039144.1 CocE/NonD family hydrolase [Conexibacter stalactiti]